MKDVPLMSIFSEKIITTLPLVWYIIYTMNNHGGI